MKMEIESSNVDKTSRKRDALHAKKGKIMFSAMFSLPLRGGKIDGY